MLTLLLGACGFHLRGQGAFAMPFQTLYVQSANDYSPFIVTLKNSLQVNGVQLADSPEQAQLTLHIVTEAVDKQILSLSGAGRVREYRLRYRISLRAYDMEQQDWLAPEEITLSRDFSYDDTQVLAKEQEEALLYENMRGDAVQQVLRRLNHAKPAPPKE
jgi:LPS-assembly lipoprotein